MSAHIFFHSGVSFIDNHAFIVHVSLFGCAIKIRPQHYKPFEVFIYCPSRFFFSPFFLFAQYEEEKNVHPKVFQSLD